MSKSKAKTAAPLNVAISTNLLGSGSYGCSYLASYRAMELVSENFVARASRGETHGQAKDRVRQGLGFEAHIIVKLADHPGVPLPFGVCSERAPFCIVMQFHGDGKTTNL